MLERDPFQCSVECGWSGSFYRLDRYETVVGRNGAMNIINGPLIGLLSYEYH